MRPEDQTLPDLYYDATESKKYTGNTRIKKIQLEMTERAIELLAIPEDATHQLILDVGCGSGLSGDVLSEHGYEWVGIDISQDMLNVAVVDNGVAGDLVHGDIGHGLPFLAGVFDHCISISCLQWLCTATTTDSDQTPQKRLLRFFTDLHKCLRVGARAVFQVYPDPRYDSANGNGQMELMMTAAMRCGFGGGLVVDYPNSTKRRKFFLCLTVGGVMHNTIQETKQLPQALTGDDGAHVKVMQSGAVGPVRRTRH